MSGRRVIILALIAYHLIKNKKKRGPIGPLLPSQISKPGHYLSLAALM